MANKSEVLLHGASLNIVRQCGHDLKDVLQAKFGCTVQIDGVDFESDQSRAQLKRPTVRPEKRFSTLLVSGVQVSVFKADLTNFPVDAVVNAANEKLHHAGGLAQALCAVGGPQIQMESDNYIRKNGVLKTGDAIVTGPGSLPCQCIIHSVGPRLTWSGEASRAKPLLAKAITSVLDRVQEYGLKTVAIPAVSSGLFNYPLPECADTIVTAVKQYCEAQRPRHLPQEIFLVNNDEPTVKEMERACHLILTANTLSPYSQAAGGQSRRVLRGAAKDSGSYTVQLGFVELTLRKGKIEEQQADVIVNTTSTDRNLKVGEVSKALLRKAGDQMQAAIHASALNNQVIITKPFNLKCKEVFHTLCECKSMTGADKIFSTAVLECLWMAATHHHSSIAFPAIGTGNLGFSKEEAARIMTDAVIQFSARAPTEMDVHFVIFPADKATFKAFEARLRSSTAKASHPSASPGLAHSYDVQSSRGASPRISLSGAREEGAREAKRWLDDLFNLSDAYVAANNFIQHFDEEGFRQLSRLTKNTVDIEEFFQDGRGGVFIKGRSVEDVAVVAVQVEAMLCNVQREFVEVETRAMTTKEMFFDRKTVDPYTREFSERESAFKHEGLKILKVERVDNPTLKDLFDHNRNRLSSYPPQKMYQRIPAQFCSVVSSVGFHVELAPPKDPAYGEGIYFAGSVKTAMKLWHNLDEEYVYLVEASVLTGKATQGKPGLIAPPAVGQDPFILYDSVSGGSDVSVIFSGSRALPAYIIVCGKH